MVPQDASGDYFAEAGLQLGRRVTDRNTPSVVGAAFFEFLLWDRSAGPDLLDESGNTVLSDFAALEAQAVLPPVNATEMAHEGRTWADVEAKLGPAHPLALATDVPLVPPSPGSA